MFSRLIRSNNNQNNFSIVFFFKCLSSYPTIFVQSFIALTVISSFFAKESLPTQNALNYDFGIFAIYFPSDTPLCTLYDEYDTPVNPTTTTHISFYTICEFY